MAWNKGLRPIRFVIYLTTIFYALLNALGAEGSSIATGMDGLTGFVAATVVGLIQLGAAILGLVFDYGPKTRYTRVVRGVLLTLAMCYFYEFVLVLILTENPFRWAPLLVFAVISAVLYLAEE